MMQGQGSTNRSSADDAGLAQLICAPDALAASVTSAADTETANSDLSVAPNPDAWRVEVAARLQRYRTRRKPRTPRYPSLLLPFDAPESWSRSAPTVGSGSLTIVTDPAEQRFTGHTFALHNVEDPIGVGTRELAGARPVSQVSSTQISAQISGQVPEVSAKVIEFPRSAALPVFHSSALADPVWDFDRPRIVEAPEVVPPPPALGGMLIEPAPSQTSERSLDFVCVPPSAPIARRALAALVDGSILAAALAAFAAVFFHFNPFRLHPSLHAIMDSVRGPLPAIAGALLVVVVMLWAAYQYLFVVYTGSTPGLRAARLRLAAFDGSLLNRRCRRWRVLASFLSAFSAGLGYFWCVLDQNGFCWHDRITRTHLQTMEAE